jgi:K+-sensing histidine kinase KdpD
VTDRVSDKDLARFERLSRLLGLQTLLAHVAREIGPALELQPVLRSVLGAMRSLVDFRGGTILLVDDGELFIAAADPPVDPEVATLRLPVGSGLSGRAIAEGRVIYSPDVDTDDRVYSAARGLGPDTGIKTVLLVPLVCLGEAIGVIEVDSTEVDAFDEIDRTVLEGLATQVAGAIESARRYEHMLQLERLKNDFIGRISHELRTPLTIMAGFVGTLLGRGEDLAAKDRHDMLQRTQLAITRLSGLIDELLLTASFEAGMSEAELDDVAVAPILEQVRLDSVDPDRVTVTCPTELQVRADARLLKQILGLLVDNAMKYAGDADLIGEAGSVSVRDHGPGVAPELREQIFERFVRGNTSAPGMGLGLSLVRSLAGAMGADIELVAPDDGGACFRLRFPS